MTETKEAPQTPIEPSGRYGDVNVFRAGEGGLPTPPENLSSSEERLLRKRELTAAFRLFGRFGFSEGVAGHITARDPEFPDHFWLNPFAMSFNRIKVSDLLLVNEQGEVVEGEGPVNMAGFHIHSSVDQARPDVVAAAHAHSLYGKAFSSAGMRARPDHAGRDGLLPGPRPLHRIRRPGRLPGGGHPHRRGRRRRQGRRPPEPRPDHRGAQRGQGGMVVITMERSCQAQLVAMAAGKPISIDHETA